jgi:hypothetical protein
MISLWERGFRTSQIPSALWREAKKMRKVTKYLALLAVVVMLVSVMSAMSEPPPDMKPVDGIKHPVIQTMDPPTIDGYVDVPDEWPAESFIGYMWIREPPDDVMVAEVYMMFDWLSDPDNPYVEPDGYEADDWTGFYLYIGIKALSDYTIGVEGNVVEIDWDQDGYIDFVDHNRNSAGPPDWYSTLYARQCGKGVEWAIPYYDDFQGICESPMDIYLHIEATGEGYTSETATFPQRDHGPKLSTTICPWELEEPEPPHCGDYGMRTIGFWKHQLRAAAAIDEHYHQHVSDEELEAYLEYIDSKTTVEAYKEMTFEDALGILERRGKTDMDARLLQQLLGTWLNYAAGELEADLDGDGVFETDLWEVIQDAEYAYNNDPSMWEHFKDLCDEINNSGPE